MKKIILFIFLLFSITIKADNEIKIVEDPESILLKNNEDKFRKESDLTLSFDLSENKLDFYVHEKVIEGNKIFLLGKGDYNVNIISFDEKNNEICIPISKTRKLLIRNMRLNAYMSGLLSRIPEDICDLKK